MQSCISKRGQVGMWAEQLINEYHEGKATLNDMRNNLTDSELDQLDKTQINSMADSMDYSLEWLEVGREPGTYRGADKRNIYRIKQYEDMDILPDITEQLRKEREPLYMDREQRQSLIQLFRNFSDRERQCYIMHVSEQLSMQKIADRLGITKATVQSYISRAKEKVERIAS